ncbi:MAG: hypothetical protein ORN58_02375, partial [Sediminibacterium sp.]|nr:hypothetical protein [Sediminibacterium sp.]
MTKKNNLTPFFYTAIKSIWLFLILAFYQCARDDYHFIYVDAATLTTDSITNIQLDSASVHFTIKNPSNIHFTGLGICFDTVQNPPNRFNQHIITDTGLHIGNKKKVLAYLQMGKQYYVRSFALFNDTVFYSNTYLFKTLGLPALALAVDSIYFNTAKINVTINNTSNLNITKLGIYYSKTNNMPTINDSLIILDITGLANNAYSLKLSNLTAGSSYYVRYFYEVKGIRYVSAHALNFSTLVLPTITTHTATNITFKAVTQTVNIANAGNVSIGALGICYSKTNSQPTIADSVVTHANTGVLAGSYSFNINNLLAATMYYLRGYIIIKGIIYYGNIINFTTLNLAIPTLTTNALTNITTTTATGGITIANPDGAYIAAAGICYSSSNATPTTNGSYTAINGGNLTGSTSINITNLSPSTMYYVRGYVNYNGTIYYGNVQTVTTQASPMVATNSITNITTTTATANIAITNPNALTISNAGVCYSSSNNLHTISNSIQALNSGALAGNYALALSGLTASTTYYVRGYVNFNGTYYYGSVQTFTTANLAIPTLATNALTNITTTTATGGITITNPDIAYIAAAGICYSSTNASLTTNDTYASINGGNLSGSTSINITNLTDGTTYFARAYINYNGT